jgi:hypothetical protein
MFAYTMLCGADFDVRRSFHMKHKIDFALIVYVEKNA